MPYSLLAAVHLSTVYSQSQPTTISVNTIQSTLPLQDTIEISDLNSDHASACSFVWTPEAGKILVRVVNDRQTLELVQASDNHSPVRFQLPSRVVSTPGLVYEDASSSLHVLFLTESRSLYRFSFPVPDLFNITPLPRNWCKEYVVKGYSGSSDGPFHVVDPATVLIGMVDGDVLKLEQTRATRPQRLDGLESFYDNVWKETILKSSSSFLPIPNGLRFAFSSPSSSSTDYPSQVLSFDSYNGGDISGFAFSVTRNRSLRVWSLVSNMCVRTEDLPALPSSELGLSSSPSKKDRSFLLPAEPRRLVRVVPFNVLRSSDFVDQPSRVLVFVPTTASPRVGGYFQLYNVSTRASSGDFYGITDAGYKMCSAVSAGSDLRDFIVVDGKIWVMWDQHGQQLLECSPLVIDEFTNRRIGLRWTTVSTAMSPEISPTKLEDRFLDSPDSLASLYLSSLLVPDLLSPLTLQTALKQYSEYLIDHLEREHLPAAISDTYSSVAEHIAGVVGSVVKLEKNPQTGDWLWGKFRNSVKREWETFVARCVEIERAARWPLALAMGRPTEVIVLERERIGVVVAADEAMNLRHDSILAGPTEDKPATVDPTIWLCQIAHSLFSILSPTQVGSIKHELLSIIRSPLLISAIDVCLGIYDRLLGSILLETDVNRLCRRLHGLPDADMALDQVLEDLSDLTDADVRQARNQRKEGELFNGMVTSYASSSIEARVDLAFELVLLVIFISSESTDTLPDLPLTIQSVFATYQSLSTLSHLCHQPAGNNNRKDGSKFSEDDFTARFGSLQVSNQPDNKLRASITYSLLHTLLPEFPQLSDVRASAHAFFRETGVVWLRDDLSALKADAVLLNDLRTKGHLSLVKEIASWYPPSPAVCYVLGRTLLDLKESDDAAEMLEGVAAAFEDRSALTEDDAEALSTLFPAPNRHANDTFCYRQMASWFEQAGYRSSAIVFWKKAIEMSSSQSDVRDLWYKVSAAQIDLGLFQDAYTTLVVTPYKEEQDNAIRRLVEAMCLADQADQLIKLSFAGSQSAVEDFLEFKARNHDPLQAPDYSQVLYAWHVSRGNFRSAGAVMYHHARRLTGKQTKEMDYAEITTWQARCYLAAINCMSLIDEKHAWVASMVAEGDLQIRKRRRLRQYIPEEMFTAGMKDMEIVDLKDVKQEYALALAKLEIVQRHPELGAANASLSPHDVVSLFSQEGSFDSAISTAASLQLDMTSVFQNLTSKCVHLAKMGDGAEDTGEAAWVFDSSARVSDWEGTMSDRAWRYLRLALDRQDGPDTDYRYRKAVLEKILELDAKNRVPSWLIKFFAEHHPEHLIRTSLRYGLLQEAVGYTIAMIKRSNNKLGLVPAYQAESTWLPYVLIDEVIAMAENEPSLSAQAQELKKLAAARIEHMEKHTKVLRK